jgi:hypothetical protein
LQVAEADVHQGRVEATLVLQYVRDAAHIFVNGLLEGLTQKLCLDKPVNSFLKVLS